MTKVTIAMRACLKVDISKRRNSVQVGISKIGAKPPENSAELGIARVSSGNVISGLIDDPLELLSHLVMLCRRLWFVLVSDYWILSPSERRLRLSFSADEIEQVVSGLVEIDCSCSTLVGK